MRCVLVLLTLICVVGCRSQWTDPNTGVQLEYKIVDDHVAIGYGQSSDDRAIDPKFEGHITMPKDVDGLPVTAVSDYAFYGCHLTSMTLPPCLRTIGRNAFLNSDITQITFPDSKVTIDSWAFNTCQRLFFLKLPANTFVFGNAFSYCRNLNTLVLPEGGSISPDAFHNCVRLKNLVFPKSLYCSVKTFQGCKNVQCVFVPKDTIESWAKHNVMNGFSNDYLVMIEYDPDEVTDWAIFVRTKAARQMEFRVLFDLINSCLEADVLSSAGTFIEKWKQEYGCYYMREALSEGGVAVITPSVLEQRLAQAKATQEIRDRLDYKRGVDE